MAPPALPGSQERRERPHLSRAPITEALIDIQVALPLTVKPADLEALHEKERDGYPTAKKRYRFGAQFKRKVACAGGLLRILSAPISRPMHGYNPACIMERARNMEILEPDQNIGEEVNRLVDEYRTRCLWFLQPTYYPTTPAEQVRVLEYIERHGDLEAFRRAGRLKRCLSTDSSAPSAAS